MIGPTRRLIAIVLAAALLGACGGGDDSSAPDALADRSGLTPTYPPTTTASSPTTGAPAPSSTTVTTRPSGSGSGTSAPPVAALTARIQDPVGDATGSLGGAPAWADLAGGVLTDRGDYFELEVQLGDPAPHSSGGSDRTMNVATFFDVDGDGAVDYEIWANLSDGGWDGSWFDDRTQKAAFSEDAAIDVVVEGSDLVVRFPPEYVGMADRFRWSLASEYGTYALLGTAQTSRDDAPDADGAVTFPQ